MKTLLFSIFVGIFALLDPDPDPETQINADPDPQPCMVNGFSWTTFSIKNLFTGWKLLSGILSARVDTKPS